jgi:hypothetical protein
LSEEERVVLEQLFGAGVAERSENGRRLIILPRVVLPAGCQPAEAFGVYVASAHGGYQTRLFLESAVKLRDGRTPAVTADVLCGRTMYAASWQGVPASLPVHEGVLAHLRIYEGTV